MHAATLGVSRGAGRLGRRCAATPCAALDDRLDASLLVLVAPGSEIVDAQLGSRVLVSPAAASTATGGLVLRRRRVAAADGDARARASRRRRPRGGARPAWTGSPRTRGQEGCPSSRRTTCSHPRRLRAVGGEVGPAALPAALVARDVPDAGPRAGTGRMSLRRHRSLQLVARTGSSLPRPALGRAARGVGHRAPRRRRARDQPPRRALRRTTREPSTRSRSCRRASPQEYGLLRRLGDGSMPVVEVVGVAAAGATTSTRADHAPPRASPLPDALSGTRHGLPRTAPRRARASCSSACTWPASSGATARSRTRSSGATPGALRVPRRRRDGRAAPQL